jgi:hypothetical protein
VNHEGLAGELVRIGLVAELRRDLKRAAAVTITLRLQSFLNWDGKRIELP